MKRLAPLFITGVLVVAMLAYVVRQGNLVDALTGIDSSQIALLLSIGVVSLAAQAQQFRAALAVSDDNIGVVEAVGLSAVNTMANYYVPARGGTVVRGAYMYSVHSLSVSSYAVLTVATVAMGLVVAIITGLGATVALAAGGANVDPRLIALFVGSLAFLSVAAGASIAAAKLFSRSSRFSDAVARLTGAVSLWRGRPAGLATLFGWTVVVLLAQSARLYVAFRAVGADLAPLEVLLIGSLVSMSFVISLTPGNLGIKEGLTTFAAALAGVDADVALLASLVDRGAALVVTFGVGLVFLAPLMNRVRAARNHPSER